jgi:hypothetical protein
MLGLIDEHVCGLMRTVVASQIEAGLCYDIWLRKFAAAYLNGTLAPIPKSRGRQVSGNWDRNLFLIESIQTLTERFGLKPSRNEASAPDRATGQSASEILSDGFAKHNRHEVTPRAIEEVWKDKKVRNWASVIQTEMATRRLDVDQPNLLGLAMMGLSPDSPERSDDDLRTYMRMFPAKFGSRR